MILKLLTEGMSIRAVTRITGASKTTVLKLIVDFGEFATAYQDMKLRNLPCKDLQLDEIWSFVGCKQKTKERQEKASGIVTGKGDIWTWTAVCRDTKLIPSWFVGARGQDAADTLVADLAGRLANRVQISSDGFNGYAPAIKKAFGDNVDYGQVVKVYSVAENGRKTVTAAEKLSLLGNPKFSRICTSHVERANLSMRMGMRRFTRLSNGFSKTIENHAHQVAIYFLAMNFVMVNQSIKTAPAVAAGLIEAPLTMGQLIELFDQYRAVKHPAARPKRYKARRTVPKSYAPTVEVLIPWYLDPESGGRNPEVKKAGIRYED